MPLTTSTWSNRSVWARSYDPRTQPNHFLKAPKHLVERHLAVPMLALAGIGGLVSIRRRDKRTSFFAIGIASIYIFFAALVVQDPRYTMLWIPLVTLFAAIGLCSLSEFTRSLRPLLPLVVVALAAWQAVQTFRMPLQRATGYDEVARYVLERSESPVVMFDGFNNGYFTYFMRALDEERGMWVLRGDKVLSSSALMSNRSLEVHAETEEDIKSILDRFGVEYVAVEQRDLSRVEIHNVLRRYLESGPFELELSVPVLGRRRFLEGQSLFVYRYLEASGPEVSEISIPVPLVGRHNRRSVAE